MAEGKHAPGPWTVEFDSYNEEIYIRSEARDADGFVPVAVVAVGYAEPFDSEQFANACLIAAAPDLLSAAARALEFIHAEYDEDAQGLIEQLRAALAKAEGRT